MAPDRLAASAARDDRKQRADAEGSTQTGSGSLEHGNRWLKLDRLAKSISADRHLLTWRRLLVGAGVLLALAAVWGLVIPWIN